MVIITLSKFLQDFPIPPLHHRKPDYAFKPWVFWSGSKDNSVDQPVHGKMMSSFFCNSARTFGYICQFWAPVTENGMRLLSTSGQPFAVGFLSKELAMYRQYSENHKYNMDEPMGSGGLATAFLNRFPCVNQLQWIPSEVHPPLNISIMLPICFRSTFIGVLELTGDFNLAYLGLIFIDNLKKAGLSVFSVKNHIPYQTISGLRFAKDKINKALDVVCQSHNLALAQVWIAYEDKNRASSMEVTKLLALKLTGSIVAAPTLGYKLFHAFCDVIPLVGEEVALKTLCDYESRYVPKLHSDTLIGWDGKFFEESRGFTICLRCKETGAFDYAFEFIWTEDYLDFDVFLEAVLLTLKRCLPRFKLASGAELGDELDVMTTCSSREVGDETQKFKIFQGKRSSVAGNLHGSEATLTFEVGYGEIKFHLYMSQANFGTLEKEIGKRLKLTLGTYKLEYLDEDGYWISFNCDEEMDDGIQSARMLLRVLPS